MCSGGAMLIQHGAAVSTRSLTTIMYQRVPSFWGSTVDLVWMQSNFSDIPSALIISSRSDEHTLSTFRTLIVPACCVSSERCTHERQSVSKLMLQIWRNPDLKSQVEHLFVTPSMQAKHPHLSLFLVINHQQLNSFSSEWNVSTTIGSPQGELSPYTWLAHVKTTFIQSTTVPAASLTETPAWL